MFEKNGREAHNYEIGSENANDYNDLESQAQAKLVTIMEANSTILAKRKHTTLIIVPCVFV